MPQESLIAANTDAKFFVPSVWANTSVQIYIIGPLQDSCDLIWIFYWNLVNVSTSTYVVPTSYSLALFVSFCVVVQICAHNDLTLCDFLYVLPRRKLKLPTTVGAYIFSLVSKEGLQSHESIPPSGFKIHGMFSYII